MKPYVVGFIFARGGSKGVPRKNIRPLAGKPLIAYAIEIGIRSERIDRVIVSTDDLEIAEISRRFGAEVPFLRPLELAQDDTPEWLAWKHAIKEVEKEEGSPRMDIFVSIPPTSPLRSVEDVDNCISAFVDSGADIAITVTPARRHPSFNMVTLDENDFACLMMPNEQGVYRRQDISPAFDITTVAYVSAPEYILNTNSMFDGKVKSVIVPEERSLDIDTRLDFDIAEFLVSRNNTA